MDINNYRNCINNLINWQWNTLKQLKRKRRRNILLRGFFTIFSLGSILFCVFAPPLILSSLLIYIGITNSIFDWTIIISFFLWLWFISPTENLSKKERKEKNNRKVEVVKAIEKARKAYNKKYK